MKVVAAGMHDAGFPRFPGQIVILRLTDGIDIGPKTDLTSWLSADKARDDAGRLLWELQDLYPLQG